MTKTRTNEEIIAALLQHGTVKDAATAIGISPRALYDRMKQRDFRAEYADARTEITRAAVSAINDKLSAAIDTIAEVMTDKESPAGTRLQAAKLILENAGKFTERLDSEEAQAKEARGLFSDMF